MAKNHLFFIPILTSHRLRCHRHRSSLRADWAHMTCSTGTDFRIPQKGAATKGNAFASHKYAGKSALRYELGVDILAGNLVWIQGS